MDFESAIKYFYFYASITFNIKLAQNLIGDKLLLTLSSKILDAVLRLQER